MEDKIEELETIIRLLQLQREALTENLDKVTKERNLFFKQKQENIATLEVVRRRVQALENPIRVHLRRETEHRRMPEAPWRVYLCSRWGRQAELREYRDRLIGYDFQVMSRWLDVDGGDSSYRDESSRKFANIDLDDIVASNIFIAFSEAPGSTYARGGRHVELGFAMAHSEKLIAIVGPKENIFHSLLPNFETFDECLKYMVNGG